MRSFLARSATNAPFERSRLAVFAMAAVLCATAYWLRPASRLWPLAALGGIGVAVWHGAYDAVLAEAALQPRFGARWRGRFYAGYLSLAGLVLVTWWLAPSFALTAFLLYSALHFGTEAQQGRSMPALLSATALGFVPVAAACHGWAAQVTTIFAAMLRGQGEMAAGLVLAAGRLLGPVVLVAAVGGWQEGHSLRRAALLATELLLFGICPPVMAFAVFFCLWHTPEHLVETSRGAHAEFCASRLRHHLQQGIVPWLVSLAAIGVAAWLGRHTLEAYTGTVFIALSALTVPHMALGMLPAAASPVRSRAAALQGGVAKG